MADKPTLPEMIAVFDSDGALAEAEQALRSTRRGLFAGAAAGAVMGALGRTSTARARGASQNDIAILNYALGLEYIQASFYTARPRCTRRGSNGNIAITIR